MIVTGYQTLEDKDNIDEIELDGPFQCTHKGAWLGTGCYFWDTNFDWALDWGDIAYQKRNKEFVVGKCNIDLSKDCFDLFGVVQHQIDLKECIEVMIESGKIRSAKEATISNLIQFMKNQKIFNYKSIRAADMHRNVFRLKFRGDRAEHMIINQRVQICVIDKKDVLLHPFKVIYPEKYLY